MGKGWWRGHELCFGVAVTRRRGLPKIDPMFSLVVVSNLFGFSVRTLVVGGGHLESGAVDAFCQWRHGFHKSSSCIWFGSCGPFPFLGGRSSSSRWCSCTLVFLDAGWSRRGPPCSFPSPLPWQIWKKLCQCKGIGNTSMELGVVIGFRPFATLTCANKGKNETIVVELSRKRKPSGICRRRIKNC